MTKVANQKTSRKIPCTASIVAPRTRATASPSITPWRWRTITVTSTPHYYPTFTASKWNDRWSLKSEDLRCLNCKKKCLWSSFTVFLNAIYMEWKALYGLTKDFFGKKVGGTINTRYAPEVNYPKFYLHFTCVWMEKKEVVLMHGKVSKPQQSTNLVCWIPPLQNPLPKQNQFF